MMDGERQQEVARRVHSHATADNTTAASFNAAFTFLPSTSRPCPPIVFASSLQKIATYLCMY